MIQHYLLEVQMSCRPREMVVDVGENLGVKVNRRLRNTWEGHTRILTLYKESEPQANSQLCLSGSVKGAVGLLPAT